MLLQGKVAIVTGGATGIGLAIAKDMAKEGASVVLASRSVKKLEAAKAEIEAMGGVCLAIQADVGERESVKRLAGEVISQLGRIDILVNNAAILDPYTDFFEVTDDQWDRHMKTNLYGAFICTQEVCKYMKDLRYGKVINITSCAATGSMPKGTTPYLVSKVGLIGLTQMSAKELGDYNINVNCIAVGRILTDITYSLNSPEQMEAYLEYGKKAAIMGRLGVPEDIAYLASFLASDKASFMTGQTIDDAGGRIDKM